MNCGRRDFLKTLGVATVCTCTGLASLNSCSMILGVSDTPEIPKEAVAVSGNQILIDFEKSLFLHSRGRAGKLTLESAETAKIILAHYQPGQYKAFSDRCTHGGRELNYLHDEQQLKCSSFGQSTFKVSDGKVVKGPAEEPLTLFPVKKFGNILKIDIS